MAVDKNMGILVVDDYSTMTRLVKHLLKQLGFTNIDESNDGPAALQRIATKPYQLIISDWNMEPMSGLELLKTVRASGSRVPFIMVTAENKTENVVAAREAGVNGYIIKPFNTDTLKAKLSAVLGEF